jgi:hypothetical protein
MEWFPPLGPVLVILIVFARFFTRQSKVRTKIFSTILLRQPQCEGHSRLAQQILDSSIVTNPGLFNGPSTRKEVGAPASQADSFA